MESGISAAVNTGGIFQLLLLVLAALGACAAALFTWFAASATAKANRGQTILTCLDKYISIMRDKSEALERRDQRLAKDFYRELFDLHWSEFHLWHEGAIPNHVMKAWITVRRRNFQSDSIGCTSGGGTECKISYAAVWGELKGGNYFELDDPFVAFMDRIHTDDMSKISNINKLKKGTKRSR